MGSNTAFGHDPAELGELERSILLVVWRTAQITAEQVREELGRPLKDSTIRTVLRRLEEKGYLAHSVENRTFVYSPALSRARTASAFLTSSMTSETIIDLSALSTSVMAMPA